MFILKTLRLKGGFLSLLPRLRNHNSTDDENVDFRSFRKILFSKHEKLMQCSGFVSS